MRASIARLEEQTSQWGLPASKTSGFCRPRSERLLNMIKIVMPSCGIATTLPMVETPLPLIGTPLLAIETLWPKIETPWLKSQHNRVRDSAQIEDSMSSDSDDGSRDAGSVTTEIDCPPKLPKGLDASPSSDVSESDPKEVEPEIAMQDTNDTSPLEIPEPDKCATIEGKEEAEDEGTDDEILSALSRSRSSLRRRGSLTSDRGTLQATIDVDGDGESSSGSSSGNSEDEGSGAGNAGSPTQHHVGGGSAVGDLVDATLEVGEIDNPPSFPTFVPRRLGIPGVCARLFRQPDIIPWDVYLVSSLRHLITGAAVNALMDTSPWSNLSNGEAPLTFIHAVSGRRLPHNFVQDYLELKERHLKSYWKSTHFLPITEVMSSADQALSDYYEQRRQRRSRAGAAWRRFLTRDVIPALRHSQCDLDILLDPFFLHFPKSRVTKHWFPKLDVGASSLAEALDILDLEEPWRLQFRHNPQDHPAIRVACLRNKLLDPRHVRPSVSAVL
ncbi:unnamed protein product [Phytophthora fragariaefolia]|uniref:Unnamed protein product n=1 Tax=Phytophthora fragariaefolia TaxID=1490495 RepID=A0A9W6YN44_9STRA|nr:unnamed protein product [Phytophthora fragariaefolia]